MVGLGSPAMAAMRAFFALPLCLLIPKQDLLMVYILHVTDINKLGLTIT